ncbi:MAG TPA: STAS domain-containing protein [Methylomirabilota bacterium]|nr:STAS domain-containing protein [Methylomirabilota bacterium]
MSEGTPTALSVCVREHAACVRIAGQAKFTSATDFKNLILQLQSDGCTEIVLDLTECTLMDSTFLGVMTAAARRCDTTRHEGGQCILGLFNPTERVLESLENLDVLRLFKVFNDRPHLGSFERVAEGKASRVEITRTCFEAHEALRNTSDENERRFKDATEFFRRNLDESEGKE